jgi:hypothetical protein
MQAMAKARVDAGICGHHTTIEANADENFSVILKIESDCKHIKNLAENLTEVNALNEISFRKGIPDTLQKGAEYCTHAACPVPVGIIKTIEVAAGLALPKEVKIEIEK